MCSARGRDPRDDGKAVLGALDAGVRTRPAAAPEAVRIVVVTILDPARP